ncbi:STAS domain-containing protein [Nocardioides bruguierae]|uniref:Anti-sigma factor antagonist n=1 Tax=Nocardioides bruguierae TaxID=2945102 RepID=A0A9X2D4F9_9ACTN|nr:STAS domain-containing protein [Nocardioides bruguierae]MCL8024391.1 STAS domain-containing protein [Nocardioides bruguierae]MCM0618859.1 STAS domain-containing protein [Nocardioides bruguierae]
MIDIDVETLADGVGVVRPHGRLTMVAARRMRELLADLVAAGSTRVVVDLSATEFMDSSGLGAIIAGLKTARQAGGDLRLAAVTEPVMAVLQLTNMDRVLRARPSVEEAFRD